MNAPKTRVGPPEHIRELIKDSGISGALLDFVEEILHFRARFYEFEDECLLSALQSAKNVQEESGENQAITATQGVIAILRSLDISFTSKDAIKCFAAAGFRFWTNRELEYFDYICRHAQFPAQEWMWIFSNWGSIFCHGYPLDVPSPDTIITGRISEGLNRHIDEKPPENSPLSLYFWLNTELWMKPATDEERDDKAEMKYTEGCREIFLEVLKRWTAAVFEKNDEDEFYRLDEWINLPLIFGYYHRDRLNAIYKTVQDRPFELPPQPIALKDVPLFIRALNRKIWVKPGHPREPGQEEVEALQAQLQRIAELCAGDQLKSRLSQATIKELIHVFQWVPRDCIGYPPATAEQIALVIKFLALFRHSLRTNLDSFQIQDYKYALQLIVREKHEPQALRQLLITLRNCDRACSNERLNFRPKLKYDLRRIPQTFSGLSAEFCLSCMIDMLIQSWQVRDRRRQLCLDLADYCMSRLKFKKRKRRPEVKTLAGPYENEMCTEVDPIWRRAYAEALGELGYALDGKVPRLLDFVRNHDPNETVRKAAHSSYRMIHRERTKELDDSKGLQAAFWLLRRAQREALKLPIDHAQAKLLRRQELRGERQTSANFIYCDFLDPLP